MTAVLLVFYARYMSFADQELLHHLSRMLLGRHGGTGDDNGEGPCDGYQALALLKNPIRSPASDP